MNVSTPEEIEAATTKFTDGEGKLNLPKDMHDTEKFLIRHAKRTRDAQAQMSTTQSQLREAEAANKVLAEQALQLTPADYGLSPEEITALENVKFRDPEAYRLKMNALEISAKENKATALNDNVSKAQAEASNSFKATSNIGQLKAFREANPEVNLTDDVLANDVPPRFINGYNSGGYDYSTYIAKVAEYLGSGSAIVVPGGASDQPNLSNQPGAQTPGKKAAEAAGKKDYAKITF